MLMMLKPYHINIASIKAYDFYIVNINGSTLYRITIVSFVLDLNA